MRFLMHLSPPPRRAGIVGRGYPPPEEESQSDIGTPLQQWESEMRYKMSREEWYHYRLTSGWWGEWGRGSAHICLAIMRQTL